MYDTPQGRTWSFDIVQMPNSSTVNYCADHPHVVSHLHVEYTYMLNMHFSAEILAVFRQHTCKRTQAGYVILFHLNPHIVQGRLS